MGKRSRLNAPISRATQTIKQSPQDIYCAFRAAACKHPNRPALTHKAVSLSYSELMRRVEHLAGVLSRRSVHRGDRIALLLPNGPQMVEAFFSLLRLGAAAVLAPTIESPQEMSAFIQQAEIKGMIISEDQSRHLEGLRHRHNLEPVILVTAMENAGAGARMINPLLRKFGGAQPLPRKTMFNSGERLRKILKENAPAPQRQIVDPTETVAVLYDGSPEVQNLVIMDHTVLHAGQEVMAGLAQVEPLDVVLNAAPLHTGFGLTTGLLMPLLSGACLALPDTARPRSVLDACRKSMVTVLAGGEKILAEAAAQRSPKRRADRLRMVLAADAPLGSHPTEELAKLSGEKPRACLGLRQAAGAVAGSKGDSKSFAPLPGVELELRRGNRLWARGANVAGGWVDTGLEAEMEDGGRFTLGVGGRRAQVA